MLTKFHRLSVVRWSVVFLLLAFVWPLYRNMILYTCVMFREPLEDMSHGWLVPFVSLFVVWSERRELRQAAGAPSVKGFLWVCLFMVIAWFGGRGLQSRMEQVSLIGLFWAVPYALWGKRVARLMLFPAVFLAFTIPVSSFVDFFTIRLRVLSSALVTFLLNGLGIGIAQSGTALFSRMPGREFSVDVADGCSGIHSLFAMMALTAAYAYFSRGNIVQKGLLFACSVPLAVIGNICRIFSICLVAVCFGQKTALGFYHDFSGYVVFLVGVLLMIETNRAILRWGPLLDRVPGVSGFVHYWNKESAAVSSLPTRRAIAIPLSVGVLAVALLASHEFLPTPATEPVDFVASSLPENVGNSVSDVPLFCHNEQCLKTVEKRQLKNTAVDHDGFYRCPACGERLYSISLGEQNKLPKDTVILKRNYYAADGATYCVSVVIGGQTRGGIHRPELCLPAQGFTMTKAVRCALPLPTEPSHVVRLITATRSQSAPISLVYWFVSRERECCSHTVRIWTDIWDRSIHNRINRWVMVAVNVSPALDTSESRARFEAFLSDFYPHLIVHQK